MVTLKDMSAALARFNYGEPIARAAHLHEYVPPVARENLLVVVDETINKDNELNPPVC